MDKKFKVGDYVICRESHLGENTLWVKAMGATVGKKLAVIEVSSQGNWWCRCEETGDFFWYMPQWLEPYPKKRRKPKVFNVGDTVVCRKSHEDDGRLFWSGRMNESLGKPLVVVEIKGDGNLKCSSDINGIWTYIPDWLEYYKEFKVGDIVICKKRQESTENLKWVGSMDSTIGKPMTVVGMSVPSGNLHCRIDGCTAWAYAPEWLEYYTEKGNEEVKKDGNNLSPIVVDENVYYGIKEIISNPAKRATTVIFNDGKKVCVKAGVDVERPDIYSAVTAAIGIHFAGSNNALKTIIKKKTTELKPKRKGTRKEFTIEAGDLVKLTKRAKKDAAFPADAHDGENHPHFKVRIEDTDREMLVAKVEDGIVYANVPERIKDYDYKIPVEFLRITRKGE